MATTAGSVLVATLPLSRGTLQFLKGITLGPRSTSVQDVHCLHTIATRIYFGLFVAESKFRAVWQCRRFGLQKQLPLAAVGAV
jgi:hypothetical protein